MSSFLRALPPVLLALLFTVDSSEAQATARGSHVPEARVGPGRDPNYGLAGTSTWTASALQFSTYHQSDSWSSVLGGPGRYLTATGAFVVGLLLPQGAAIEMFEVEGCTAPGGVLDVVLATAAVPANPSLVISELATSVATPACDVFQKALDSPVIVDNKNNQYFITLENLPNDGTSYFSAVRVYYRLQVSPPPATATFNDVPVGNPYFQFVEALAASGVTAGCGGGNFCPDAPVTRAQMATFLSRALGLYWPN